MAAVMAATYPELYGAAGIHSGLAHGSANDVVSAFAAMRGEISAPRTAGSPANRLIVIHGDSDRTVHPANATNILETLTRGRGEVRSTVLQDTTGGRMSVRTVWTDAAGKTCAEHWQIAEAGHAWSGGSPDGSYTDPQGPDASRQMLRFFLEAR